MSDKAIVLVIDDSLMNLALLDDMLERHGFQVTLANTGERGLAFAKESLPDIILLDVIMPGWDGYETCKQIKSEKNLQHIPILFLSALDNTENKVRALQAGAVDYVSKPFQEQELIARVKTHVELAHLRKNLEREVARQTEKIHSLLEALQTSYDRIQQVSILKSQFLHNVSHEFRTPMNIILGMAEMLTEDTPLNEEQIYYTKAIISAGKQLMEILTNMLNFAQQFSGELNQIVCDFQIEDTVDRVVKTLANRAEAKHLQLSIDIASSVKMVLRGNQNYISEVLTKLLDNAIKFTHQGNITIRVQPLQITGEKQWIRIEVSDTGIGIAPEHQIHLFDVFSQVDTSETRLYQGMGMGLAVAKLFTENMGGHIGVESILDKGSTFWFNLPLEVSTR